MSEAAVVGQEPEQEKRPTFGEEIFDWIESIVFPVIVVVLISTFVLRPAQVIGPSMEPTLHEGDRLYLTHLFYTPKRGDVVVVNSVGLSERIVKRVIALEGDTVDIDFDEGTVSVNGEVLDEPYINEPIETRERDGVEFPLTVPEGTIFVMGDNRNHSTDSRSPLVGFVSEKDIVGKVLFRIFPFDAIRLIK